MECDSLEAELLPPSAPRAGDFGTSAHSGLTGTAGIANFERRFTDSSGTLPLLEHKISCGSIFSKLLPSDDMWCRHDPVRPPACPPPSLSSHAAALTASASCVPIKMMDAGMTFTLDDESQNRSFMKKERPEKKALLSGRSVSKDKTGKSVSSSSPPLRRCGRR